MSHRIAWKRGAIIRNIISGKPLLVIHIYSLGNNANVTLAVDLEDRSNPTPLAVLQERDYDHWVIDSDMKIRNNKWEYDPYE